MRKNVDFTNCYHFSFENQASVASFAVTRKYCHHTALKRRLMKRKEGKELESAYGRFVHMMLHGSRRARKGSFGKCCRSLGVDRDALDRVLICEHGIDGDTLMRVFRMRRGEASALDMIKCFIGI